MLKFSLQIQNNQFKLLLYMKLNRIRSKRDILLVQKGGTYMSNSASKGYSKRF